MRGRPLLADVSGNTGGEPGAEAQTGELRADYHHSISRPYDNGALCQLDAGNRILAFSHRTAYRVAYIGVCPIYDRGANRRVLRILPD
jgi:hypothetical protein